MKLAIIGSRGFSDYKLLKGCVINSFPDVRIIVSGGAKGADQLGETLAKELCLPTEIYLPEWSRYGRSAGLIRNSLIIKNSDALIAFWDGSSPGTKKSIEICRRIKKKLIVVPY
ncbi:MAG TPA: SLOG family protein [Daejeonella sp.]